MPVTTENRALVAALLAVDGVAEAAVEPDAGGPGTLRLQLRPGADEVKVAGAVNRLLRTRFGLAVDADRVQVLDEPTPGPVVSGAGVGVPPQSSPVSAPAPAPAPEPAPPREPAPEPAPVARSGASDLPAVQVARPARLGLARVSIVTAGLGVVATVHLSLDGREHEGEAEGAATSTAVLRSAASAALRAVERVVDGRARFEVEHVEVATTGPERTALVVVTLLTDRGSERLSGASVVRDDARQAVIRAALAAVNRRVEALLAQR